jgi:energy-coupling factor transporter ATP-binding protein EcfA2
MKLLIELNRTRQTTFIIVTHNHEVARLTQRVVTLRDGKIQSDVRLRNELESDLYDLKMSALGQALLRGDGIPPEFEAIAPQLREILKQV